MATMISRLAYPHRCVCFDCGDPSHGTAAHRLMKRSAKFKEHREARREIRQGMDDFYEDDELVNDVVDAFDRGEKLLTSKPPFEVWVKCGECQGTEGWMDETSWVVCTSCIGAGGWTDWRR